MYGRSHRLAEARRQLEFIAKEIFGVDISKALNPLKPKDFDVIIDRLGKSLNVASVEETRALKKAIENMDADWASMSEDQIDAKVVAAGVGIAASAPAVVTAADKVFGKSGRGIVGATKRATADEFSLTIHSGFNSGDLEAMQFSRASQGNFISDSILARGKMFSRQARGIVADGLEKGLGRRDLVNGLQKQMTASGLTRKRSYYNVVAAAFSNRSRTWGQLSSYGEASIKRYFLEAMLDEVTTKICRLMHGKSFEVQKAVDLYQKTEGLENPQEIKEAQPWVRDRKDADGNEILQIKQGDEFKTVARVLESAVGKPDQVGRFSQQMSDAELMSHGVMVPPFHGGCRTILIPDL